MIKSKMAHGVGFVLALAGLALCGPAGCNSNVQSETAAIPEATSDHALATTVERSDKAVPDFVLQDLSGNPVRLSDFTGKAVFINFWATWCPPCKAELPDLVAIQSEYGGETFMIVGISLDQIGPAAVQAFVDKAGLNFPILMGNEGVVEAYGNFRGIPTSFLINASHEEVKRYSGMITKAQLVQDLKSVLGDAA
jgi:thiol-disulfide isomerase/thioredoxin